MSNSSLEELMHTSGVAFGTSGARGLVSDMSDRVCYAYTLGFIQYLEERGQLHGKGSVAVGGDLRPSSARIMSAVGCAISARGYTVEHCGRLPSPALALRGLSAGIPTVMVTGSHIPADRNGIKYTTSAGEILKQDEAGMKRQILAIDETLFDEAGMLRRPFELPAIDESAAQAYLRRYLDFFGKDCLTGLHIGIYQHSAVGRDLYPRIFSGLGARIQLLGHSDAFVPVDTEAIRPEDTQAALVWTEEYDLDAIVSTDGDSDRPLLSDERGHWLRGDVLGILCANWLGAEAVATPVSCNTAVERCGCFAEVLRTRIGSPYVIVGMQELAERGHAPVVGYEANGGFLLHSEIRKHERVLAPLPTRDPVLPQLSALVGVLERNGSISQLVNELPRRYTYSDRLKNFPLELSHTRVNALDARAASEMLGLGEVEQLDRTDGLRITFTSGEIVHIRPSGNAPELRCYTEANSEARARKLTAIGLAALERWRATV